MFKKIISILVVCMCLSLSSCGKNDDNILNNFIKELSDTSSPSYKMDEYLKDVKEKLVEGSYEILNIGEDKGIYLDKLTSDTLKDMILMLSDFDYHINSEEIKGNSALVNVTFYTYDFAESFKSIIKSFVADAFISQFSNSNDDIFNKIDEKIKDEINKLKKEGKTKETIKDFMLNKIDGEWEYDIDVNSKTLIDGLCGEILETIEDLKELFDKFN